MSVSGGRWCEMDSLMSCWCCPSMQWLPMTPATRHWSEYVRMWQTPGFLHVCCTTMKWNKVSFCKKIFKYQVMYSVSEKMSSFIYSKFEQKYFMILRRGSCSLLVVFSRPSRCPWPSSSCSPAPSPPAQTPRGPHSSPYWSRRWCQRWWWSGRDQLQYQHQTNSGKTLLFSACPPQCAVLLLKLKNNLFLYSILLLTICETLWTIFLIHIFWKSFSMEPQK